MMVAAKPIGDFVDRHPTIKMLALSFLIMVGMMLMVEGFGVHVPKGYIYAAMAFSALVEFLNILGKRKRRLDRERAAGAKAEAATHSEPVKVPAQVHGAPPTVS